MFSGIHTDAGIIRKVLRGHTDAFSALVDRYGNVVYGVAYARTGNAADAEDLTQDVFVRLYQWLDRVATRTSVGPWLVEVARNAATDLVRKRRHETPLVQDDRTVAARDFAREEMRQMVWEHLADLDESHREVLILHYFQGVKIREIARLLDISNQAAAKRLQRSRDELGRRLIAAVGEETAATEINRQRARRVLAAIASAPAAWQPSASLSLAGAAIVGASAAKVVGALAVVALIAIGLFAGWRHVKRPYNTQNITEQSEFSTKATAPRSTSTPTARQAAAPTDDAPAPTDAAPKQAVAPKAAIYGFVFDEALRPVAGATVGINNRQAVRGLENMKKQGYCPYSLDVVDMTTETGEDGSFYFDRVALGKDMVVGVLHVHAQKGDLYGEQGFVCTAGIREQYVELMIGPAALVSGHVIDESGAGIPEAKVTFFPESGGLYLPYPGFKTAANGSFKATPLMPGPYQVCADCVGYAQLCEQPTLEPGQQALVLRLVRGNSISGRLTFAGDGSPLPDVTVCTWCKDRQQYSATTDAAGRFQIYGLDADTYEFRLAEDAAPYVIAQSPRVPVTEGQPVTGVELQASAGAYVSGTIRDERTGEPAAAVMIRFSARSNNYTNGTWPAAYSDEKGHYSAGPLLPNTYEVILWSNNSFTKHPFTLPSLQDMQGVDFTREHHLSLGGTVVDADGKTVAGASVVAAGKGADQIFAVADDAGRFSILINAEDLPVYLQAHSAGRVSRQVGPARDGENYELTLQPAARIEGTVVDTAGRPQPGMLVVAEPDDSRMISIVTPAGASWYPGQGVDGTVAETSISGTFQMDPVLPGNYELQVYAKSSPAGYPAATAKASVIEGETLHTRLVLDMRAFGSVEGKVIANGAPSPVAYVSAKCEGEQWLGNVFTRTDAEGSYRLSNLRPGRMTIAMRARIGETKWDRSEEVYVAAGETQRVDFEVGDTNCGFEGVVTLGDAGVYARLVVSPSGSTEEANKLQYDSDSRGYYRIADLEEGLYDIEVRDLFYAKKVFTFAPAVQARANEITRLDFSVGAGNIEGAVTGIREGEVAQVAVFPGNADFTNISAALRGEIIASKAVIAGEPFKFDPLPVGVYYLGAVGVPADRQSDEAAVLSSVTKGRYTMSPVEVLPGQTVTLDLAIP